MNEVNIRPVTPSKIPVGKFRVEMEKDINRAMFNGGSDSNLTSRSNSPPPVSRIPLGNWRSKATAYQKLMERQEKKELSDSSERNKRQYFKLNGQNKNGMSSKSHNVSNYAYKKSSGDYKYLKSQNGGGMHHPMATSNGGIGHVGLMSTSSHTRSGGHGSKVPSR